jgi:hypothetical protein
MASSRGDEGGSQYYSPPARKSVKSHADKPAWKTVLQERCTARIREARRRLLSAARERPMNVRDVLNQIVVDEESGRAGWLGSTDVPRGGSGGAAGGAGFGRAASACGAGSVAASTELDEDLTEEERLELLLYLEDTLYRDMQDGGTCGPYRSHLRSHPADCRVPPSAFTSMLLFAVTRQRRTLQTPTCWHSTLHWRHRNNKKQSAWWPLVCWQNKQQLHAKSTQGASLVAGTISSPFSIHCPGLLLRPLRRVASGGE